MSMRLSRPFRLMFVLLLSLLTFAAVQGGAQANPVRTENVEATLRAEMPAAVPGQSLTVALTMRIREGWHTYWLNPGDSGLATTITWTLPPGWQAGPIIWPAPERFPIGPLVNFGYHGVSHLLVSLQVPADAKPGESVTVTAAADWLVCAEICIPESGVLSLTLPVAAAPESPSADTAALFAEARQSLPQPNPFQARFLAAPETHQLRIAVPGLQDGRIKSAFFFPEDWETTPAAAPQSLQIADSGLTLNLKSGPKPPSLPVRGVLVLEEEIGGGTVRQALAIEAIGDDAAAGGPVQTQAARDTAALGVLPAILLALLGGMILNLMPCVFPVLSMKALALVRHHPSTARSHGLAYTAGVLVCFALVAGLLIGLRAGGAEIGWGYQLQSPIVVTALVYVMLLLGLSMSGVFSIGDSVMGVGQGLTTREGVGGSFFTGVLATVVATPCTAPFMGAAIGFALLQPWYTSLAVFLALGLGMALPFLALTHSPALLRRMPRPGAWMDLLKQGLAFPLYATAGWLLWVLVIQNGADALASALAGGITLAMAAWIYGQTRLSGVRTRLAGTAAMVAALALAVWLLPTGGTQTAAVSPTQTSGKAGFEPYSEAKLAELTSAGRPVFVNFTAAWCITCLVNERTSLSSAAVQAAMLEKGVAYLKGDWTNRDAAIARILQKFGRSGVPLYLLYVPGQAEQVILPQILTESVMLTALSGITVSAK
jgi:thiol:disulfide interchange protein/DsbC/DsbD-like thiol-disulfide interchange protein